MSQSKSLPSFNLVPSHQALAFTTPENATALPSEVTVTTTPRTQRAGRLHRMKTFDSTCISKWNQHSDAVRTTMIKKLIADTRRIESHNIYTLGFHYSQPLLSHYWLNMFLEAVAYRTFYDDTATDPQAIQSNCPNKSQNISLLTVGTGCRRMRKSIKNVNDHTSTRTRKECTKDNNISQTTADFNDRI